MSGFILGYHGTDRGIHKFLTPAAALSQHRTEFYELLECMIAVAQKDASQQEAKRLAAGTPPIVYRQRSFEV